MGHDDTFICPSCFAGATLPRCLRCDAPIWIDERVALCATFGKQHPNAYRGLWRALDGSTTPIAIKLFDIGTVRDWREHDRFTAQREILDLLDGLPVPRALGDFARHGRVFHCQTLLAGSPLGGARSLGELRDLARQLLLLLDEIHCRGVLHRDLKPEHVVVDAARLQLIDFGAARRLDQHDAAIPTVVGTPGFMAPEQLLGEASIASDLYAAGKVLACALGARSDGKLQRLLRALTHEEWRKRPASGARAAEWLDDPKPRASLRWALATVPVICGVALGIVRLQSLSPTIATSVITPISKPTPLLENLEAPTRALLAAWTTAQNTHDFDRYAALYDTSFHGTIKTATGETRALDHDAWLAARKSMFVPALEVAADEVHINVDPLTHRATLSFVQRFRTATYADHGTKEIDIDFSDAARASIVAERMLDSHLGWDETDQRQRFPAHGATCEIAFNPSAARYVIALGHFDDYRDALRAAGKARRRGIGVEVVWGDDFEELERGYWLLAGATNNSTDAYERAKRTHGVVWSVHAAAPRFPSVLRVGSTQNVQSSPAMITTSGDTVYTVTTEQAIVFERQGDELVERYRAPLPPKLKPVRVAVREGHAYVLDDAGHWSLIAVGGVTRTRSFDPEPEGTIAVVGSHRFELEPKALTYRFNGGEAHRMPLASELVGIWPLGETHLVLYRQGDPASNLYVISVGKTPRQLTKLCGSIDGELIAPAHVTVGEIDLDTDREGGFELWTSQWGFFRSTLDATPKCAPSTQEQCPSAELTDDISLLGQTSLQLHGQTSCECDGC